MGRFGSNKADYAWIDEDRAEIARLLADGLSSSKIADAMPLRNGIRPTRNAVIGKIGSPSFEVGKTSEPPLT